MPRTTLYLDDATMTRLEAYQPGERELSALVRRLLARYGTMVDTLTPRYSLEEWGTIWQANSGLGPLYDEAPTRGCALLWANVHDAGHPELAMTIRELSPAQQLAILDVVERLDADPRDLRACLKDWKLLAK